MKRNAGTESRFDDELLREALLFLKTSVVWPTSKRCAYDKCEKRPSYGMPGKRPTHCAVHGKELGFVDVSKRCAYDKCEKRPSYGMPGKRPTHCAVHKELGFVDVVSKRCAYDKCKKYASYGMPGKKRTHCAVHRLENMIDVANKLCDYDGCNKHPSYGMPGKRPTHCADHKVDNMADVVHKRCTYDDCNKHPVFGIRGQRASHCADHKSDNMVDVLNNHCAMCNLIVVKRKGNFCASCNEYHANGGASRKTRAKERAIVQALRDSDILNNVRIFNVMYDKSIGKACGGYRPDILIDCGTFIIIIEIDEHQHRARTISRINVTTHVNAAYAPDCERTRMINIRLSHGVPCHVIRINPDAFKIDGETVRVSIKTRHAALCDQVKLAISNPPSADLVVTYMYYDDALLRNEIVKLPSGYVWDL